jgi:dCTP deaminase
VILSDRTIRAALAAGRIGIDPLDEDAVQPSSVDVRLGSTFRVFANHRHLAIDPHAVQADLTDIVEKGAEEPFVLHPGEFVLGSTLERITLPDDVVARLEGKSSLARLGLVVHSTAGFIDAGFDGDVTLELSNVATLPILLHPGMRVAQLAFFQLDGPAEFPYGSKKVGSKYQGQRGPTASRYHLNLVPPPDEAS